ncbi:MAG: 3'(2'),5'-bisphosphate nucleotidase [Rhodospirillaceae bacterium TMED167]|nr:3'(2'),5'-bisphosphate nucleotidase [Rhodospirillaceae bacterium]MDG2033644.1 3'(2'),5'-bisphosphate nucleotidase CysQ [Rhodospirillales bacterium]OUW27547.1 MAG: 3'(2'),5'-bisphosphate nucleotidase [Rhodospirillaceae bacterium TMED167]
MSFSVTNEMMAFAVAVARAAGDVIMEIYNTDFDVHSKDDGSPVTEADEKGEALIRARLKNAYPDIPFIGEEAYSAGYKPLVDGGLFWLVDALDGTKEFIHKRGEFTVNIALIDAGVPVFGVVHAPAKKRTFWGAHSHGAFAAEGKSAPRGITTRTPNADGLVVVASRSHRYGEDEFLKQFTIKETVTSGSSLKFCLVAAGEADMYPRMGPTSEWDTAAGHAVLLAAGGQMTQIDGSPFVYGKDDILNPHFIAQGQPD